MYNLKDKVVVITGGTRGIGQGMTKEFLNAGANVIATFKSNEKAAFEFRDSLGQEAKSLRAKKCDVTKEQEVNDLFDMISETYQGLDILVNNSGIRRDNLSPLMSEEEWCSVINTNLSGTFRMSKKAISLMLRKRWGRIINITSVGGRLSLPGQCNYAASKAGQEAMSRSLAKEVAKKNITVNNIAPGFIETDFITDLGPDLIKEYKKLVPMRRFGKVSDVAALALFLSSDQANYITGTTIDVAGGL